MHKYKFYDQWDGIFIFRNLCLRLLCNKCHATIANVCSYHYVTFALLATYAMGNLASILRHMNVQSLWPFTHLTLSTSLPMCLSSVLSNFCFHHSHKVILFLSSLILYNTSYFLLLKSSSFPHHISTMSAVKFSSHCFTLSFNLMVFTVLMVPYTYPMTHIFKSFVFNKVVFLMRFLNYFSMSKYNFLYSIQFSTTLHQILK